MLYSVRGKLIHMEPRTAVIECAGVGYKCFITMHTARQLPALGGEVILYTILSVREDAVDLFGFADQGELNCFRQLTSVSGVGPKAAVAILSELSPERVAMAVASGDYKTLTRASGVGPKLAQRIVLEMKDKVGALQPSAGMGTRRTRERFPPPETRPRRFPPCRCWASRPEKPPPPWASWTAGCRWKYWCVRR